MLHAKKYSQPIPYTWNRVEMLVREREPQELRVHGLQGLPCVPH
jgi:hypothetical protein